MPLRPALRPGALLLRRSTTTLQIGTTPGIRFPDQPGLMGVLKLMNGVRTVGQIAALTSDEFRGDLPEVIRQLRARGAIVDGLPRRLAARFKVAVLGDHLCTELIGLIQTMIGTYVTLDETRPDISVVVSSMEPHRSVFESAQRSGQPHLPVTLDGELVRVGPFVRPALAPCVGCYDAWRTTWDRAWPAILVQCGRQRLWNTGISVTVMHAVAALVAAEILTAVSSSNPPQTHGRVAHVGPSAPDISWVEFGFQHRCGCHLLAA